MNKTSVSRNCKHMLTLLSEQWDGRLDTESAAALAEHLAGCEACRVAQSEHEKTRELVKAIGRVSPPPGFVEKVMDRLGETPRVGEWIEIEACSRRFVPYVAAALLLLTLGALAWPAPRIPITPGPTAAYARKIPGRQPPPKSFRPSDDRSAPSLALDAEAELFALDF